MSSNVLAARDVNTSMASQPAEVDSNTKPGVMSMEHHRQVFQSKMEQGENKFISPSDNIMSPCTAKLSAFRSKQVGKVKPKSLFAQASAKKLGTGNSANGAGLFGSKPAAPAQGNNSNPFGSK
ncbi:protein BNS1 [Dichotomopilus funicola]|uniref:Protein BNS1 n=1 Tax=Dichotomopilus funicola TaxID=1934379 RepID=A0AAN6ZKY2_9PEZI|nr:protein BNS1 [Dichotomopilus funicola]